RHGFLHARRARVDFLRAIQLALRAKYEPSVHVCEGQDDVVRGLSGLELHGLLAEASGSSNVSSLATQCVRRAVRNIGAGLDVEHLRVLRPRLAPVLLSLGVARSL